VVVKPTEVAPLAGHALASIFDDVGLPAGVFNLLSGFGPVVGEALAAHPGVDMVSFTGSTRAGKRVAVVAAETVKRVALELGGKSANVLLDDADFERAVADGVAKCYINSGQTCSALTRMLVPVGRLAEAEQIGARVAGKTSTAIRPTRGPGWGRWSARSRWSESGRTSRRVLTRAQPWSSAGWRAGATLPTWAGVLRAGHGVLRRHPGDDDRPRGDLRPGPVDHAVPG
jgi:hypothetical protein